ncbi:MAG: hypothetical protein Ct9H300mP21_05340 [Pseudomonadota bacterium]|nr:MAG: hypothetical protein Ct9H300mP21_05340 [Pseudomonadota bacterium]
MVPEAFIEHQDLVFNDPLRDVKKYYQSLHSEDITYLKGPSGALQFGENFSLGLTLYYHYRSFMRQYPYFLKTSDDGYQLHYESNKQREDGFYAKNWLQWSPWSLLTVGMALDQTFFLMPLFKGGVPLNTIQTIVQIHKYTSLMTHTISKEKRKFPLHLAFGQLIFLHHLYSTPLILGFYKAKQKGRAGVINYSGGSEYYFDPKNAVRFGLFTNHTNLPQTDSTTIAPFEYIDIYGASFGYTSYSSFPRHSL